MKFGFTFECVYRLSLNCMNYVFFILIAGGGWQLPIVTSQVFFHYAHQVLHAVFDTTKSIKFGMD